MDWLPRIESSAKTLLGHKWVIRILLFSTFACCVWFWAAPAEPGIAIAVLGALAAVMTFAEMTSTHKLLATIAVFALMAIEIRDIRKDRIESDRAAHEQRTKDQESFDAIAGGINAAIQQSQSQFDTTIKPVQKTLENSQRALYNTAARAILSQESPSVYAASLPLAANNILSFDVNYTNVGNDTAMVLLRGARSFIGKIDDEPFQREAYAAFDRSWKQVAVKPTVGGEAEPTAKRLFSFLSGRFSQSDFHDITVTKEKTIYIISRIVYSDRTGKWVSDECDAYQDVTRDWSVLHPCLIIHGHRYRATWQ